MLLGEAAVPAVALVLVFNSLILWTLVTVSVEWARHGELSVRGFGATLKSVLTNPIVVAILSGTVFGLSGFALPAVVDTTLGMVAEMAAPLALIALGMGLAKYRVREGLPPASAIIGAQAAGAAAGGVGDRARDRAAAAGNAGGGAARLDRRRRQRLPDGRAVPACCRAPVAASIVLSTLASAFTTPLLLALLSP